MNQGCPVPIVPRPCPGLGAAEEDRVRRLGAALRDERPELLAVDPELVPRTLENRGSLHLDDLSEIATLAGPGDANALQYRARLRAVDGDLLALNADPIEGYDDYCEQMLGLGRVESLRPATPHDPLCLAMSCWQDDTVRRRLLTELCRGRFLYLHPHMGTRSVWALARLLQTHGERPVKVIAPPPALSRWVNHKVEFAQVVQRLFGESVLPPTRSAGSWSLVARHVRDLAVRHATIAVKLPDAAGGRGNLVLDSQHLRGKSLSKIREFLTPHLHALGWNGQRQLLICAWEVPVVSAPATQFWIPPRDASPPALEGVFEQRIRDRQGSFAGCRPAAMSTPVQQFARSSLMLARLFQELGYVGRCSFDAVLVGRDAENARVSFIECNGRWGGASLPMTLMNRLFGDWTRQAYATRVVQDEVLRLTPFPELLDTFRDELFDARHQQGRLVFFNPGRMRANGEIGALALGATQDEVESLLTRMIPERLRMLAEPLIQNGRI